MHENVKYLFKNLFIGFPFRFVKLLLQFLIEFSFAYLFITNPLHYILSRQQNKRLTEMIYWLQYLSYRFFAAFNY